MRIVPLSSLAMALVACAVSCAGPGVGGYDQNTAPRQERDKDPAMQLGAFSVSLAVQDLTASRSFYEKLGFRVAGGDASQGWLILRNGTTTIGIFQGMFERNILTFNPGWSYLAEPIEDYTDVRELQRRLKAAGLEPTVEADESTTGPGSLMLIDPDGNPVLIDQHVG